MNFNDMTISPITRALAGIALVGFYLILVHLAAPVLVPILFAFFLIALALPVFQWLQRRGLKRGLALFLLVALLLAVGLGLLLLALISVKSLQSGMAANSDESSAKISELAAVLASSGVDLSSVSEQLAALSAKDEFEVIDWPGIFDVPYTPFAEAVDETFNDPTYGKVVLEF